MFLFRLIIFNIFHQLLISNSHLERLDKEIIPVFGTVFLGPSLVGLSQLGVPGLWDIGLVFGKVLLLEAHESFGSTSSNGRRCCSRVTMSCVVIDFSLNFLVKNIHVVSTIKLVGLLSCIILLGVLSSMQHLVNIQPVLIIVSFVVIS